MFEGIDSYLSPVKYDERSRVFVTKGYQCIIHIWSSLNLEHLDYKNILHYNAQEKTSFQTIYLNHSDTREIYYETDSKLQNDAQMWKIISFPGRKVNLTINVLNCIESNKDFCKYSGITAYSIQNKSANEMTTFYASNKKHKRNEYSQSNVLIIVAFSQKQGVLLKLNMTLSSTKCQIRRINACQISNDKNSVHVFETEVTQRCSYKTIRSTKLIFSVNKGACIVFQFNSSVSFWTSSTLGLLHRRCQIKEIRHKEELEGGKKIDYTIMGVKTREYENSPPAI